MLYSFPELIYNTTMSNTTGKSFIEKTTILKAEWLKEHLGIDESAVERVNAMQSLIQEARALKAQYKIANKRDLTLYFDKDAKEQSVILENQVHIETLAGFANVVGIEKSDADGMVAVSTLLGTIYLDLRGLIDVESERIRLSKELEKLNHLVAIGEKKLSNPKFVNGAPSAVVEGAKKQLESTRNQRDETQKILESLWEL